MLYWFGAYLAVAGGASAGAQVARGAVRGAARLARGDVRGALAEAAGGLAAPVVSAARQFSALGADVYQAATSLTVEARTKAEPAAAPVATRPAPTRRRREPAVALNGAA